MININNHALWSDGKINIISLFRVMIRSNLFVCMCMCLC